MYTASYDLFGKQNTNKDNPSYFFVVSLPKPFIFHYLVQDQRRELVTNNLLEMLFCAYVGCFRMIISPEGRANKSCVDILRLR